MRRYFKVLGTLFCLTVSCAAFVPSAHASAWDRQTTFTFSQPVEVPRLVLGPGTYVFRLTEDTADRNIVQIFSADQKHLYATILANFEYRSRTPEKTLITFEERAKGSPEAIKAWFYPGDNYGLEFVYPKAGAAEIAGEAR